MLLIVDVIRPGCDPCSGDECEWVEEHNKFRGMVDPPAADMSKMVSLIQRHLYQI